MYKTVLGADADNFEALHLLGILEAQMGNIAEAERLLTEAIRRNPLSAEALSNRGNIARALGRPAAALVDYERALAIRPRFAEALNNKGVALSDLGRYDEALVAYERAVAIVPDYADAISNRGDVLRALNRRIDAIASYDHALSVSPDRATTWSNRGVVLGELHRHNEALASFDHALARAPRYAEAWNNRGVVLMEASRDREAFSSFDSALSLEKDYLEAMVNRGQALVSLGRPQEAIEDFQRALVLKPAQPTVRAMALDAKLHSCDWRDLDDYRRSVVASVRSDVAGVAPFAYLAIADSPAEQLRCARAWVRASGLAYQAMPCRRRAACDGKVRLAYVSANFHDHATMRLMAGVFSQHDRGAFATVAVSLGPHAEDAMRIRLRGAFDSFIDASQQSDESIVAMLRDLEIDILIDLTGHMRHGRPGIFSRRAAPIQVNYLGYPGTSGAPFFDYIIADRHVIPSTFERHYSERIAYMPDSFQANDDERVMPRHGPSRNEVGLPEDAFVFCCFSNSSKVNPLIFDVWMRVLGQVDGSVLWLSGGGTSAEGNLRREAGIRGIASSRLVFAARVHYPSYLARYTLADLFLDTLPFNAGATASDALWMGMPVLSCAGDAFAARMGASLLHCIGLQALITQSLIEYERTAVRFATDDAFRAGIIRRLGERRESPLFQTERFCRHLEDAYRIMWGRRRDGDPPASFSIIPAF